MKRKLVFALAGLFCFAVAARAGDPWKQKTDKQWDDVDLRQIMTDSPWARKVKIPFDTSSNQANSSLNTGGPAKGASGSPGAEANVPNQRGGGMDFTVQWASAMTIRRAAVRAAVRRGALTEADAEQGLSGAVPDYEIAILGGNLLAFEKADAAGLEGVTYLRAKKNKQKVPPTDVEFQRGPDGKTITAVLFHFRKNLATGEPLVAPDEKSVEFVCKPSTLYIQTEFEPQRMVTQTGPDF